MQDQDDALSSTLFEDGAQPEASPSNDRDLDINNVPKYSQEWFRLKEEKMALELSYEAGADGAVNSSGDEVREIDTEQIAADEDALGVKPLEGTIETLAVEGAPLPNAQTFAPADAHAYQETTKEQMAKKQVVAEVIVESSSEKKSLASGPSLDTTNDAPVPVAQTIHATTEVKKNCRPEVLEDAPQPFEASSHDDSLLREKQKITENDAQMLTPILQDESSELVACGAANESSPMSSEGIVSRPYTDEEMHILPPGSNSRRTVTTCTTAPSTIFDAFSERASEIRYTEDTEIFIPEATLVEEPDKEDIPAAEVVVPEKYSLTIAGKNVHVGVLILIGILIITLVVGLSVSLTRPPPPVSQMPSLSPTTSSPTSQYYSSLVQTIYGDNIELIDFNQDRKAAMQWLEQDQVDASAPLSDVELRERYTLALLYFATNAAGSWYDDINFLSQGHVCTWRLKRSGEKKGALLCDENDRILQLALYGNSLEGSLPMELSFLAELQTLRLESNRIKSSIPSEFGSLSQLSELVLFSNAITGKVPETLTNLGKLSTLHLSDNIMSGPLLDVDAIEYLRIFRVDGNNFSGTIPLSFEKKYLDTFHINRNRITSSMDFWCSNLPLDYKMDCDGKNPEVICTCCVGCTIVGEDECSENAELASITISPGIYDDDFSWKLYQENLDEFDWPVNQLIAAGGEYEANAEITFQLCFSYPGKYTFSTQSNVTDSGAGIDMSIGESNINVGPHEFLTFAISNDASVEIVNETTSPTPSVDYDFIYPYYDDENGSMPEASISYAAGSCFNFALNLQTDYFGDETSWDIVDVNVGTVVRSVEKGYYQSNSSAYEYECLDSNGCYTFSIYDEWSDGICCENGNGWFDVTVNGRFLYRGGDFQASDSVNIGGSCASDPKTGSCSNGELPINVTSEWGMPWEVYDNTTGQIYCLNSEDTPVENYPQTTYKCIPNDRCMAFRTYDESSSSFFEVSFNGELVVSSGDSEYQGVVYLGCK